MASPHQQLDQNAPVILQEALLASVTALPGVRIEPTPFSLDGSKGWRLEGSFAQGPEEAFINDSLEFGHLHRPDDGSMHLLLPTDVSIKALEKGWGILHPLSGYPGLSGDNSNYVMIYGPRDESELKTIWTISQISYYYARGLSMAPSTSITPATWGWSKSEHAGP
jgi:phospholipase/carboxylesterase